MLWFAHFRSVRGGFICFDSSRLTATRTVLMADQGSSLCLPVSWCLLPPSLTVTGASPLVDVSSTQVAGNVDRRQMEELPLQGRNWMELAMQVRGITANAVDTAPGVRARRVPGRHQPVRHHPGPAVGNCCRVASCQLRSVQRPAEFNHLRPAAAELVECVSAAGHAAGGEV